MTTEIKTFEATTSSRMLSIAEYATALGITRQAVLKQINTGKVKAKKVGRSYVVLEEPPKKEPGQ